MPTVSCQEQRARYSRNDARAKVFQRMEILRGDPNVLLELVMLFVDSGVKQRMVKSTMNPVKESVAQNKIERQVPGAREDRWQRALK